MNKEDRNRTTARKSAQLGMPFGTANGKLRKKILFHLAQKCGLDDCYRCGFKIETIDEFTIEHKKAWLDVSPDLFWDLDNIAFSHLTCNVGAARRAYAELCWRCKVNPSRPKAGGNSRECLPCANEMKREWRAVTGKP